MLKHLQSPWAISLLLALLTVLWVKWELFSLRASLTDGSQPEPPQSQPEAQVQPEAQAQPEARVSPRTQHRSPVPWTAGMPPPMEVGRGFTEVAEEEQDPLEVEEGAFETTE